MSRNRVFILLFSLLFLLLAACGQTAASGEAPDGGGVTAQAPAADEPREPEPPQEPAPTEEPETPAASETPDNPAGLYMSDLMGMTTGEIFRLWGSDVTYYDDWYFGASKYFFYEDGRVPYVFSFSDLSYKGTAGGSEPLLSVGYFAWDRTGVSYAAPGLPIAVTCPQLRELAPEGSYFDRVSEGDEVHEGASAYYIVPLDGNTEATYLWLEGSDPETAPADTVTLNAVSNQG